MTDGVEGISPKAERAAARAVRNAKKVRHRNHEAESFGIKIAEEQASSVEDCKALYMRYVPTAKISEVTGVPIAEIEKANKRKNGWAAQRNLMQGEINEAIKQDLLNQIKSVCKTNIELIEAGLTKLLENFKFTQVAPSLEEVEILSKIFERLGRSKSWEEGSKTGYAELKSLSPQEVLRAFADDPYLKHALSAPQEQVALPAPVKVEVIDASFDVPEVKDYEQSRYDTDVQQHSGGPEVQGPS
jgi:hypothetical protein